MRVGGGKIIDWKAAQNILLPVSERDQWADKPNFDVLYGIEVPISLINVFIIFAVWPNTNMYGFDVIFKLFR